ncbi:uncharacterized protein CELE_H32K16.2 [Caenorhabditis elegans]|uniref:Uncharacterized protein n=1 Tax=Caenorhabditis elegans TaxID=6239 RepID=Q7YWX0_CAEEL|nr:Uncharacterized protein CELE_H32K16.2 [Caenorhabditis elegans]CAE17890.1 Uncharacterized protein CELE_H32K16.2 [Caenorhabditis elegans]|eukprot:NP_001021532.1 Uncharacterized protein CELE_H32K16.2 [Caenorhabditis elegans]
MSNYLITLLMVIVLMLISTSYCQLFGGWSQPSWGYNSQGVGYDQYGNSFEGTPQNGIYLFCNGHGCPGRG